jgi:riboflavin kinase / FMN adenylyltransferase
MLALLISEARHRGLPSCVLSFEPHPRDHFARRAGPPRAAPARIGTLRDKLAELERCGIDRVVVARFDAVSLARVAAGLHRHVLLRGLRARYVLVGDDFSFGARAPATTRCSTPPGANAGFDVARMLSYEVHGLRVSSSAVRDALAAGRHGARRRRCWAGPTAISGHVQHGRKLGRELGFRTLNLRFGHPRPAAQGIFVCACTAWRGAAAGVASLGVRPTVEDAGRVLLEVHCLRVAGHARRRRRLRPLVRVELLHKLHDEAEVRLARGAAGRHRRRRPSPRTTSSCGREMKPLPLEMLTRPRRR